MHSMSAEDKYQLTRSIGYECVQEAELSRLLAVNPHPVAYDGFEPSGRMHIAQGVMKALNVNKLTKCGVSFKFWVADWFAQMNNKMNGDLKQIRVVGEYMVEIWKAIGMDMTRVRFLSASEEINKRPEEYWTLVMDIARRNNVKRIVRCSQIMGRTDADELTAAQIFYPCMQCADIFFLKADICQLGMDQRKVNMLAREYCDDCTPKRHFKPIILSHEMVPGLLQGQEKMSKSDPKSAIFMEDSVAEVSRKIKRAFCPCRQVDGNPCLAYVRLIVLPWCGSFRVLREAEHGGEQTYTDMATLEREYAIGLLHPSDLKEALAEAINRILQPVRDHFANDLKANALLNEVTAFGKL